MPTTIIILERSEPHNSEIEQVLKTESQNVLWSAEDAFVRAGVLVHESVLYNWDGSVQEGLEGWPERDQEVQPEREMSEYWGDNDYMAQWKYQTQEAYGDEDVLRKARVEQ